MASPGGGGPPPSDRRRQWLHRVQAAADDALANERGSDNPADQMLASDLERLSIRIRDELEGIDHGAPGGAPGVG